VNTQPTLALNNGIGVPQLGFGVYQSLCVPTTLSPVLSCGFRVTM
jgi:hypothetical protein